MQPFERLESALCRWAGYPEGQMVVCSSGSSALHLALEALQLPQGNKVLCPDFAMIACARAVTLAGLEPVFVDCGDDLNIDPDAVHEAVQDAYDGAGNNDWKPGRQISALMAVHTYGRRCDMFSLRKATESYGIALIEDLAEAHGVEPYTSDAACWSFYRNKIVAGEEGGAVAFRDYGNEGRAAYARLLRNHGFTEAHDFTHIPRGHNYRLANLLAYPTLESLRNVNENLRARRQIENWYQEYCPPQWRMPPRDVVWVYDIRIPGLTSEGQDKIIAALQAEGIAARHAFKPLSSQEEYQGCLVGGRYRQLKGLPDDVHQNAYKASREVLYLPVIPSQTTKESCRKAFQTIHQFLG